MYVLRSSAHCNGGMCGAETGRLLLFNDAHHLSLHTNRVSAYAPSEEYSFVTLVQEDVADAHICPRLPGAHSR